MDIQTFWIQMSPKVLSGLIWVQTVCNNNQQTTNSAASSQRVKLDFRKNVKVAITCNRIFLVLVTYTGTGIIFYPVSTLSNLTLCLLVSSSNNFCKWFGPRSCSGDHARQNVGSDLDPNCSTLRWYS